MALPPAVTCVPLGLSVPDPVLVTPNVQPLPARSGPVSGISTFLMVTGSVQVRFFASSATWSARSAHSSTRVKS